MPGVGAVPTSSPDPLLMSRADELAHRASQTFASAGAAQDSAVVAGGWSHSSYSSAYSNADHSERNNGRGGTQILPTLPRKRSSSSDLSSHFSSPLKPAVPAAAASDGSPIAILGEERRPAASNAVLEPGFESAVKRVKLESDRNAAETASMSGRVGPGASGGGYVVSSTGGKTIGLEAVDKVGDLVSDLFGADDALVGDTSAAALSNRSPSRRAGTGGGPRYFRATAVGATSGLPLVHTDTIRRLLGLLRTVASRRKGAELLEEVEASGIARVLKLLERSWEGVAAEGWEGWDKAALLRQEEDPALTATLTAMSGDGDGEGRKGAGKKAGSASPAKAGSAKARGAKGKGKKAGGGRGAAAADLDDGEFNMRGATSSRPLKVVGQAVRRSSRSPSPRPGAVLPDDSGWQDYDGSTDAPDATSIGSEAHWNADRLGRTKAALRDLSDALLAARLALEILTLPGVVLPKQLFSSEYLLGLVGTLRHALDDFFLPTLTAPATSPVHELALELAKDAVADACDALVQAVQALADLTRREELSEDLVVALSYLSLEPFFHDAPPLPGRASVAGTTPVAASVKSLRLAALAVLQIVYARYTDQQAWIVEEVLGNLGKAELTTGGSAAKKARGGIRCVRARLFHSRSESPGWKPLTLDSNRIELTDMHFVNTRIRTGATIQTVSTLLLHLVQTCPVDLPAQVRKRFARRRHESGFGLDELDGDEDGDLVMKDQARDVLGSTRREEDDEEDGDEDIFVRS